MSYNWEYVIVCIPIHLALPKWDIHPKLKTYTVNLPKDCPKNNQNLIIIMWERHKHPSRGANRPSDIPVKVSIKVEFNLKLICLPSTQWFNAFYGISSQRILKGNCGSESILVYDAPSDHFCFLRGHSYRGLPRLLLLSHAEKCTATCIMSNFFISIYYPRGVTITRLRSYEIIEVLRVVQNHTNLGLQRNLKHRLDGDVFSYQLATKIPLKEWVL
jgi:hypothetical protein